MNLRQRLANIIDPRHHANDIISGNDPLNIRYSDEYAWGTYPETPLAKIIKRRESDLKFQQAVVTSMAFSVGMGFHLKADTSTTGGKEALAIAEDFAKRCNLDEINQLVAMDAWATGNAFLEPLRDEHDRITDLQILPVSSFIRIQRDKHGAVTGYTQQHGGPQISLTPDVVMHFKWLPRDASAWGCGLGQALAKPGVGYKNAAGKIIKRPPWFAITEMVDDIVPKMLYAGVPRYDIGVKGQGDDNLAKIQAAFNRLDPGQHTIHNFETDIKTIALDTQSRQDSFLRKVDDEYTAGLMTPVGRMWSSNNYTYKSGDAAMEAHMPLIASYARAHKKFVEFDVLRAHPHAVPAREPGQGRQSRTRLGLEEAARHGGHRQDMAHPLAPEVRRPLRPGRRHRHAPRGGRPAQVRRRGRTGRERRGRRDTRHAGPDAVAKGAHRADEAQPVAPGGGDPIKISDVLRVIADGKVVDFEGLLDREMHAAEEAPIRFELQNISKTVMLRNITFHTTLPPNTYTATLPGTIPPGETRPAVITLIGPYLWRLFDDEKLAEGIRAGIRCQMYRHLGPGQAKG